MKEKSSGSPSSDEDMISKLTDQILCSIIGKLSVQDAVKTSILSRRWMHLWKFMPCLDFENLRSTIMTGSNYRGPRRLLIDKTVSDIIDKVISSQQFNVSSCFIGHSVEDCRSGKLQRWVDTLGRGNNILHLKLLCDFSISRISVPDTLLPFRTLKALELQHFSLESAAPFENCRNLETLRLDNVKLSDETLTGILANCGLMENLTLWHCKSLDQIDISGENIKFVLFKSTTANYIKIHAMNLREASVDPVLAMEIVATNLRVVKFRPAVEFLHRFTCFINSDVEGKDLLELHAILNRKDRRNQEEKMIHRLQILKKVPPGN